MKAALLAGAVALLASSLPALAEEADARNWLDRMAAAAHKFSYSGTFVYQNGALSETSRITHRVLAGREAERIEVLDGSPREVVRNDDEIKCYLPESRTLIVERHGPQRSFPALAPAVLASLGAHYLVRKGPSGRVAERESQSILLEPRDELRYGRQLWADAQSGLLLKSALVNERGEPIESFTFTQLQIGGHIETEALQSRYAKQAGDWQVRNARATPRRGEDSSWLFRTQLPGFSKRAGMLRLPHADGPQSMHFMFSDGLAAISVFVEPLAAATPSNELGMSTMGATNVYRRRVDDHLIVLMGEVPQATLKRFGDGIEARRK